MSPELESWYDALWQDFLRHCPSARKIHAVLGGGAPIINDHIALRTFARPGIDLAACGAQLQALGYREGGQYHFAAKRLDALHFEHPEPGVPKVFISELRLADCSAGLNRIVDELLAGLGPADSPGFMHAGRHWAVSQQDYRSLLAESEYAAWLAAFGFRANHFTVDVNQLPGFDSVAAVNARLRAEGFALNASGGEIKGSPEVLLEQSSILADEVEVEFSDGAASIPACFYEFAFRYPQLDGRLYQGFVEASADKIFESTDVRR